MKNALKKRLVSLLARAVTPRVRDLLCDPSYFRTWEERGLHVTPVHYYQPVPDTRALENFDWDALSSLPGLDMNAGGQSAALEAFAAAYRDEYAAFGAKPDGRAGGFFVDNGTFESVDCEAAYCFVRSAGPERIIEVGGGNSTLLLSLALAENARRTGRKARHTVVEPFPGPALRAASVAGFELVGKKLEELPDGYFSALAENDVLFIDSSHVLRTGGDVQKLYLEVLPRLRKGVLVHIHDIFFPAEYPRETVMERRRFYTEQYLVQAFLAFNGAFRVEWCSSYLHHFRPEALEAAFPSYRRGERRPGSLWLRKII